ncbi:MAG: hypothetical protein ICV83_15490 [Cytophagales bacterium]|nr:hypothetical protein [Cytophagales bacterium]
MLVTLFFEPAGKRLSGSPEGAGNATHARPLKAVFQDLCFALLTIPGGSIRRTVLTTAFAMMFLLAILHLMAVTDQRFTATARARFHNGDHGFVTDFPGFKTSGVQ